MCWEGREEQQVTLVARRDVKSVPANYKAGELKGVGGGGAWMAALSAARVRTFPPPLTHRLNLTRRDWLRLDETRALIELTSFHTPNLTRLGPDR